MKLGFVLPQVGPMAGAEALITVAQRAEALGYSSVWVTERVLFPLAPEAPYPGTAGGSLPDAYKTVLDPLTVLGFVAAHTQRVRLGTSVLDIPYYNPVMLARQLTAVDVLSQGRLDVGLGLGWSPDEYEAVGAQWDARGKRADEFIEVLRAIWTTDPVEFSGEYFRVSKSIIGPKPVQQPHPPLYFAAYSPGAMRRTARFGQGWNPAGVPIDGMQQMFSAIQAMAEEEGRAAGDVTLVVRANCHITDQPEAEGREIFAGTVEQIAEDVKAAEAIGASRLFFDVQFSPHVATTGDIVERMERLWAATH